MLYRRHAISYQSKYKEGSNTGSAILLFHANVYIIKSPSTCSNLQYNDQSQ